MKPKTKLQKHIHELAQQLPPKTEEQERWAQNKCFGRYFVQSRKTMYCLECGHSWKDPSYTGSNLLDMFQVCPGCAAELERIDRYNAGAVKNEYWAWITTVEGVQVVRMFFIWKQMFKNKAASYYSHEVMQHFITAKGQTVVRSKSVFGLSGFLDNWVTGSELEIRPHDALSHPRYQLRPYKIWPKRAVIPEIRRNGFDGHFYGCSPTEVFTTLLREPKAETLIKAGYKKLYAIICRNGFAATSIDKFWPSIRIAIRNRYPIEKVDEWFDYLRLLTHFGRDLLNPHYVCPADLERAHNRLVTKRQLQIAAEKKREVMEEIDQDEKQYQKRICRFINLRIEADDIEILPIKSVREVYEEGEALKHCVFVNHYHRRKESLLLSARKDGSRIETIEVNLKRMEINQARGMLNNPSPFNAKIVEAVLQNMDQIKRLSRQRKIP